ncbi:uncharacterized protein EV420DRAFT_1643266 [Desarmillaria tabescens]|uniref:Uncharacterized protein n=1 Tax=Armillaria tabescens TaxID=1929756 RepID=A0AA39N5E8_ARMTA|nr:uncharacterized protein EV420DRAFT_1643266 [Desarmillaria tabescens]KAK0457925.1 hypothetical protein EV420DRAFT_1643266 [Desarmillaria tabescens]
MVLGRLQAIIDETTALFNERQRLLATMEKQLRDRLRAETYTLTASHLDAYQRVSVTDIHSLAVYASKSKDTWKKAREYYKRIADLKANIEKIKLLEDAEVNEQAALEHLVHRDDTS